uniref:Uncharacterized protein n=1 Tax=Anguilla anguilla TaxID=7936 RepID=A0A0E9RBE2_ANGAN
MFTLFPGFQFLNVNH